MLRSLYVMLDYHIAAKDGEGGRVADFLFDDESWTVHYLVVQTESPFGKRNVLILPFALGQVDWKKRQLPVLLTCEQIRTSPPLESDMPIALQQESGLKLPGAHLRSMREVLGYHIHSADGEVGRVKDFIIEDTLWVVHHAVIALNAPPLRSILLSPESFRSLSWASKAAWVNLSLQEIKKSLPFDPSAPVNHDDVGRLYDYYSRPVCPPPPAESAGGSEVQQP